MEAAYCDYLMAARSWKVMDVIVTSARARAHPCHHRRSEMRWTCCFPAGVPGSVQGALGLRQKLGDTELAARAIHGYVERAAAAVGGAMTEAAFAVASTMEAEAVDHVNALRRLTVVEGWAGLRRRPSAQTRTRRRADWRRCEKSSWREAACWTGGEEEGGRHSLGVLAKESVCSKGTRGLGREVRFA
jgi:hypothetical protein